MKFYDLLCVCVLVMGSDAALERMKSLVPQNWICHCQAVANESSSPCNSCC